MVKDSKCFIHIVKTTLNYCKPSTLLLLGSSGKSKSSQGRSSHHLGLFNPTTFSPLSISSPPVILNFMCCISFLFITVFSRCLGRVGSDDLMEL